VSTFDTPIITRPRGEPDRVTIRIGNLVLDIVAALSEAKIEAYADQPGPNTHITVSGPGFESARHPRPITIYIE